MKARMTLPALAAIAATCAGLLRMPDGRLVVAANDGGQAVVNSPSSNGIPVRG